MGHRAAIALLGLFAVASADDDWSERERTTLGRLSPLGSPPADTTNRFAEDERAAHLGQWLFFDAGLSGNGEVSCATCHDPELGFSDGKPVAETLARGTRRTPSVVNAAFQRWLFWDGRADSLWAQAVEPIENPIEMGGDRVAVVWHLAGDAQLRTAYEELFGALPALDGLPAHARPVPSAPDHPQAVAWAALGTDTQTAVTTVLVNVGKALGAYERRLVRGDAPFDRYVAGVLGQEGGDLAALDAPSKRGLELFVRKGNCTLCHLGPTLSDLEFHNTSAPPDEFGDRQDPGRYVGAAKVVASPFNAAGPYSDDREGRAARRVQRLRVDTESFGEFRTPSLRNLKARAPYMHAGQFADLEAVLRFYSTLEGAAGRSHHQELVLTPLNLTEVEIADLVAFLGSLEGQPLSGHLTQPPAGPRSPR